ncbi:helix-turn-helix transcriptional regulator [Spirosoma sp. BT702]|uniref:Helix-turn-helix transcriptional regulator n=1 Tax=Spirosoma profusum TaxID=2771354 RepID=A0A926XX24_9BACT|nr:helix-turn-helix transcriptional regulator [Spirosoma profusum]MBD2699273.1 helix-turn-helix transcriptional regulator [Spirosoma profusum]
MNNLPQRIRKLREFVGYRQHDVADKLGITQFAYSKLERGETRLDIERIEQIADFYGLAPVDLMYKKLTELRLLLVANVKFEEV